MQPKRTKRQNGQKFHKRMNGWDAQKAKQKGIRKNGKEWQWGYVWEGGICVEKSELN